MSRDPRTDPHEGDELRERGGVLHSRRILVDGVDCGEVFYRVVDADGGLLDARRVTLAAWRELAPTECEEASP